MLVKQIPDGHSPVIRSMYGISPIVLLMPFVIFVNLITYLETGWCNCKLVCHSNHADSAIFSVWNFYIRLFVWSTHIPSLTISVKLKRGKQEKSRFNLRRFIRFVHSYCLRIIVLGCGIKRERRHIFSHHNPCSYFNATSNECSLNAVSYAMQCLKTVQCVQSM